MDKSLYLFFTAFLWSAGGLFIKLVNLPAMAVAGGRSAVAFVTLLLIYRSFPLLKSKSEWALALSLTATVTLFVNATKMGAAANAIFLQSTAPLYVALFSVFFLKEKLRLHDFFTLGLVIVGMLLFFADEMSSQTFMANLLGLSSGVTFAIFMVINRKLSSKASFRALIWGNLFTFLLALPIFHHLEYQSRDIWGLLFLGIFQLALPYYIYSKAAPYVPALKTSLIFLLEPLLNPIWVFLVMGEKPTPKALVGGLLVLSALVLKQIWDAKTKDLPKAVLQ